MPYILSLKFFFHKFGFNIWIRDISPCLLQAMSLVITVCVCGMPQTLSNLNQILRVDTNSTVR